MNRSKSLIIIGMILLLTGCTDFFMICSLNPFYLEQNVVLIPEVEGRWAASPVHLKPPQEIKKENTVWGRADTTLNWQIERVILQEKSKNAQGKDTVVFKPTNYYQIKLTGCQPDSSSYLFRMVLFRSSKHLYADFMPLANTSLEKSRFAKEGYFSVHTLARVNLYPGKRLDFSWLGADYMKMMIEKKRVRLNYQWSESAKRLLLTGSSEQLTGMIERYAGEPRFIDWENQPAMLQLKRLN